MIEIIIKSILLGIGLSMDACAISMVNGLKEPKMKFVKMLLIAITFAVFQALMPLVGYFIGSAILFKISEYIPLVALVLLSFIGIKMIYEGFKFNKEKEESNEIVKLTVGIILLQAVASSIDALTVGFSISNYTIMQALVCVLLVAIVTFSICLLGVYIGKKFGAGLGNKAQMFGGTILIIIGIEIFITSLF